MLVQGFPGKATAGGSRTGTLPPVWQRNLGHVRAGERAGPCSPSAAHGTYAALRPVDVQEGEGEQGFVPFFGQQLLLELNKVGFQVNHFWSSAIGPKTGFKVTKKTTEQQS